MVIKYTTGYAGTGKSTELIDLVKTLDIGSTVVICPTHKAIARLREYLPFGMEIKTIHALLGWIPTINEDATKVEYIDSTAKLDRGLAEYANIIIDEGGMMSEEMFMSITSKLEEQLNFETDKVYIHVFLDPYQLLPVKGLQIQVDPETTTNLTTQHRAESLDVVCLFTKFVNYLEKTNLDDLTTPPSENVIHTKNIIGFKKGDRFLAYTNKCVGEYNQIIAHHLDIHSYIGQEVQLGNMVNTVVVDDYIEPDLDDLIDRYNKGMGLLLQNSQINKNFIEPSLYALLNNKNIKFITSNDIWIPVIEGIGHANIVLKKAKEAAIEDKKKFKDVYALGRAFIMDYSFASTVHKAQGSEFDRVWIHKPDIQKSILPGWYDTYARLMYVSISRAKQKVFIIGE